MTSNPERSQNGISSCTDTNIWARDEPRNIQSTLIHSASLERQAIKPRTALKPRTQGGTGGVRRVPKY